MKFGLQMSSLNQFIQTPQDILKTFKKVKAIGYNYVQLQWLNGLSNSISAESVRESLEKSGLICVGTQDIMFDYPEVKAYYPEVKDIYNNIDEIISRNILWQAKYVSGGMMPLPQQENEISEMATQLNAVSKKMNDNGLIFDIHLTFTAYATNGNSTPLEMLWEHLNDSVLLQPDFYHVVRGKANPIALIEKYSSRIAHAHFKDFKTFDNLTPVGQGVVPYKEIIEACIKHGVKYCWAEQEVWDKDPFECMKESFDFLVNMGLDAR